MTSPQKRLLASLITVFCIVASFQISFAKTNDVHVYDSIQLASAINSNSSGGTIVVHKGNYSHLKVTGINPTTQLTIKGAVNEVASFDGITLRSSSKIAVEGLTATRTVCVSASNNIALRSLTILNALGTGECGKAPDSVVINEKSRSVVVENSLITTTKFDKAVRNFRGITIYGCNCTDFSKWNSDITIRNNEIAHTWDDLISVTGALNSTIENNYIHDHRNTPDEPTAVIPNQFHQDGIQVNKANHLKILRNTLVARDVTAEADQGIMLAGSEGSDHVQNLLIANNLIHHWAGSGLTLTGGRNIDVVNNTIVDNFYYSSSLGRVSQNFSIYITRGAGRDPKTGIPRTGVGQYENLRIWNNIFTKVGFTNGATYDSVAFASNNMVLTTGAGGANQITPKPDFVSTDVNDPLAYTLKSTSAAIDAGRVIAPNITNDRSNRARVGLPDVGAYEFNSGPQPRPTTTLVPTTRPVTTTTLRPVTTVVPTTRPVTTTTLRPVTTVVPTTRPVTTTTLRPTTPEPNVVAMRKMLRDYDLAKVVQQSWDNRTLKARAYLKRIGFLYLVADVTAYVDSQGNYIITDVWWTASFRPIE